MAISAKLLGEDETVVFTLRTHWKHLFWPAVWLVLSFAAVGAAFAFLPERNWTTIAQLSIVGVALLVILSLCVIPVTRWYFTTYTLTNRRLITRTGIINRTGHDIPLFRINDVSYERSLSDRLLGCGTLMFESAGTRGQIVLHDVPRIEQVHLKINNMLFGDDGVHANAAMPKGGRQMKYGDLEDDRATNRPQRSYYDRDDGYDDPDPRGSAPGTGRAPWHDEEYARGGGAHDAYDDEYDQPESRTRRFRQRPDDGSGRRR